MAQSVDGSNGREGVADRVTAELLKLVADGEFGTGEQLPGERRLAEMMNASRVSVRTALQRLKAQGFLASVQGGGTRVVSNAGSAAPALAALASLDTNGLQDLAEIRLQLETWAARRAADCGEAADIARLQQIVEEMGQAGRNDHKKAERDIEFHIAVARASGSPVYRHLLEVVRGTLTEMLTYHRFELFATEGDDATILEHHRAIAAAIADRDGDGAAAAMEAHLRWVLAQYARVVRGDKPENSE